MTWKEFKDLLEKEKGVTDEMEIDFIDVDCLTSFSFIYVEINGNKVRVF